MIAVGMQANSYLSMEPFKLEVPEMEPGLTGSISQPMDYQELLTAPRQEWKMDVSFLKNKTNPGVRAYKVMDDLTFVGVPLFVAGLLVKNKKEAYRQNYEDVSHPNTRLVTNFHTSVDNYLQYFGPALTVAMKLAGVQGRSSWPRLIVSSAASYGVMAAMVNGLKYTVKEPRPDGSSENSWPSGHTATAFVGATILHKEYGLTRSPWYSVLGYTVATATGIMRVLNNRHWVSDVLSGAGIGIMSTELAYAITDLIFKERGLLRNDLEEENTSPSFFSISMGVGLGTHNLNFSPADLKNKEDFSSLYNIHDLNVRFNTTTTVDVEGAYYFNKYVGVGGRMRLRAMTADKWSDFSSEIENDRLRIVNDIASFYQKVHPTMTAAEMDQKVQAMTEESLSMVSEKEIEIVNNHLTEFSGSVGCYFNLPLSRYFSLGSKLLFGRSIVQELDIKARFKGEEKLVDYKMVIEDGKVTYLDINKAISTGKTYDVSWDFLTMGGNHGNTYGTGISFTYRYKANFVWKVFVDYDYTKKSFTLRYDPYRYVKVARPNMERLYEGMGADMSPYEFQIERHLHFATIGGSFAVNF